MEKKYNTRSPGEYDSIITLQVSASWALLYHVLSYYIKKDFLQPRLETEGETVEWFVTWPGQAKLTGYWLEVTTRNTNQ